MREREILVVRREFVVGRMVVRMVVGEVEGKVCLCDWASEGGVREGVERRLCRGFGARIVGGSSPIIERTIGRLEEYFAGERTAFDDVPIAMTGTDFQLAVWTELLKIPYGTTVGYAEVARRIGKPTAVRAVASAIGANPMSILVPCHRVVGSDGSLGGYAGGVTTKAALLALEGVRRGG